MSGSPFKSDKDIVAKIEIIVYKDNTVTVNGPINNFPLCVDIMNTGMKAVIDQMKRNAQKANGSRIVVPEMRIH